MTTLSLTNIVQGLENSTSKAITLATTVEHDRQQLRQCSEELQHRLVQIRSEAEIIHTVSTAFNQKISVQQMVDLIGERLNLYYVGILLLEGSGDTAVLHACTNKIIPEGYRLTLSETSTIGWAISKRSPRMADITNPDGQLGFTQLPQARTELSLPLISGDNILGALTIQSTRPNAFNEDDIAVMQNIADSLALALDNAHLFTQFQAGLDEIRSLKQQYLVQAWSTAERTHGKLSYTFENDLPLPTDVQLSTLKTPIILRDQAIGQISLETDKVSWTPEEQGFIDSVTTEAARALENARLLEETQRRAAHERFVADITRAVRASTDIETILSTAIRELSHSFRASEGVIQLNTPTENIIQGEENGNSGN
jgi:GAF domain-containing protein